MTLVRSTTMREVDGGKWRRDETCGCAYLFERTDDNTAWTRYHVIACNQRFSDEGQHVHRQSTVVAVLPKETE